MIRYEVHAKEKTTQIAWFGIRYFFFQPKHSLNWFPEMSLSFRV